MYSCLFALSKGDISVNAMHPGMGMYEIAQGESDI
jgi:hypothetical protein